MATLAGSLLLLLAWSHTSTGQKHLLHSRCDRGAGSIYGYEVQHLDEQTRSLMGDLYGGRALMVINVATY